MGDPRVRYLRFLRTEIEDLLEDVAVAERKHRERVARSELTDYVFRQNEALFHAEEDSLRRILARLDDLDATAYPELGSVVAAVDAMVRGVVSDHAEPEAIYRGVARKLEKLRSYVEHDAEP